MNPPILTTHVGSLPRNAMVAELLFAAERGDPVDPQSFDRTIAEAVEDAVRKQVEAGIDIVSDGEMSKISYATYIKDRVSGFDGDSKRSPPADLEQFPAFLERQARAAGRPPTPAPLRRADRADVRRAARGRSAPFRERTRGSSSGGVVHERRLPRSDRSLPAERFLSRRRCLSRSARRSDAPGI
jgi:5-methyltetrahydropteroyltriglutamate--homocysteine methyltransferase